MEKFNEVKNKNIEKLKLYVPVVARVHGGTHPEFLEVHELYDELNKKIANQDSGKLELDSIFKQLRKITNNYAVPNDVCESYEAVYDMLSEMDRAYYNE